MPILLKKLYLLEKEGLLTESEKIHNQKASLKPLQTLNQLTKTLT